MKKYILISTMLLMMGACKKKNDIIIQDNGKPVVIDSLKTLSTNLPTGRYTDLVFADEKTGYTITQGSVYKTVDSGKNWVGYSLQHALHMKKIQFIGKQIGYIIGGDDVESYLWKTTNAGETWQEIKLNFVGRLSGMFFLNQETGFIISDHQLSKTTDGGLHWAIIKSDVSRYFYDIEFKNALEGICTSSNGTYFKTSNGGNTWDSVKLSFTTPFTNIYFTSNSSYIEVAADSLIDVINQNKVSKKPSNASKLFYLGTQKCIGIGLHFEMAFWPYGDIWTTNNGWKNFEKKTFTTGESIGFDAIAQMNTNKVMIIGLGLSGTTVIILNR